MDVYRNVYLHKKKTPEPTSQRLFLGTSGDTELFEKPSNINGFRASEQKNILYIPPHYGDCFKAAALFYA